MPRPLVVLAVDAVIFAIVATLCVFRVGGGHSAPSKGENSDVR